MSLVENAAFSVEIRDGIASFCVRLIDLGSVLGIDVNNECSFYAQNDLSRYGYIYLMTHKSETFEKFKEFQSEVENQCDRKIKCL